MGEPALALADFDVLYRQIQSLPEGTTGEIVEPGGLRTMGRPGKAHRRAQLRVLLGLGGSNQSADGTGWWIELEPEVRFGPRLLVPDLAGWRVDRVPDLPDENPITLVPDWCCEVLSGSTARVDRLRKLPRYLAEGVGHVWLVDAAQQTVEVYVARDGLPVRVAAGGADERLVLPPFDLEVDLAGWWLPEAAPAP